MGEQGGSKGGVGEAKEGSKGGAREGEARWREVDFRWREMEYTCARLTLLCMHDGSQGQHGQDRTVVDLNIFKGTEKIM